MSFITKGYLFLITKVLKKCVKWQKLKKILKSYRARSQMFEQSQKYRAWMPLILTKNGPLLLCVLGDIDIFYRYTEICPLPPLYL
jgi:hypothetical protein